MLQHCRTAWPLVLALLFLPAAGRSAAAGEPLRRIAFGSCATQEEPQRIWEAVVVTRPDLCARGAGAGRRVRLDLHRAAALVVGRGPADQAARGLRRRGAEGPAGVGSGLRRVPPALDPSPTP
jgi:hypothetical protein